MRIFYVANVDMDRAYGARTHTLEVLRTFGENGHEVCAFLTGTPRDLPLPEAVRVHWVPAPRKTLRSLLATYRRIAGQMRRMARTFQPDLYYERECTFDPILFPTFRRLRLPGIIEINGLITEELKMHGASRRGIWLASTLQRQKCRAARLLVCGASGWVRRLEQAYDLPPGKAVFIPNGVVAQPFLTADRDAARKQLGFGPEAFIVGFIGSFNLYADLSTMIRGLFLAHQRDPRIKGYLVGSGLLRAECEALVRELNAGEYIRIGNEVSPTEVPTHMAALDCGVAPMVRTWLEQMRCWHASTKVAEYLAAGLPIVAFDLPESDSAAVMAAVSLSVPPEDPEAFAQVVLALANDPVRRRQMSQAAREMAQNERAWDRTVQQILEALERNGQKGCMA